MFHSWTPRPSGYARGQTPSPVDIRLPRGAADILHLGYQVTDALIEGNDPLVASPDPAAERMRFVALENVPIDWTAEGPGGRPAYVLLDAPLESDGSVWAHAPPGVPFFVQSLDHRGWGVRQRRWNEWAPSAAGAGLRQDVPPHFFNGMCGTCHGSINGDPLDVVVVDSLTGASVAVANGPDRSPHEANGAQATATWTDDIQPIVSTRCASGSCHGGGARPDLDGDPSSALEALLAAETPDGEPWLARGTLAAHTRLLALFEGTDEADSSGAHTDLLLEEELAAFALWIDLDQPWDGAP